MSQMNKARSVHIKTALTETILAESGEKLLVGIRVACFTIAAAGVLFQAALARSFRLPA